MTINVTNSVRIPPGGVAGFQRKQLLNVKKTKNRPKILELIEFQVDFQSQLFSRHVPVYLTSKLTSPKSPLKWQR